MVAEYVRWEMLRTAEAATSSTQLPFPSSPLRVKKRLADHPPLANPLPSTADCNYIVDLEVFTVRRMYYLLPLSPRISRVNRHIL